MTEFLSLLRNSRNYAERAHLAADTHAVHIVLNEFYENLAIQVDELVEASSGRVGKLRLERDDDDEDVSNPLQVLKSHLRTVEQTRLEAFGDDTPLQSLVDNIVVLYLRTLYKLRQR